MVNRQQTLHLRNAFSIVTGWLVGSGGPSEGASVAIPPIAPVWKVVFHGIAALLVSLSVLGTAHAAGLLTPTDGSKPPLEIRDHIVNVVIEDGYAITTLEQVFHNPHGADFEAVYSFPIPEKAAVSEFTYWIDGKPVSGEVLEKSQARKVYEKEKAAGRETAITEQDEYRTFDISVWPVRAGQDVRIRLTYIQPAHVDTGIGRYVYPLEEGGVDERKLAFWTAKDSVTRRFSFDLLLRAAYPVKALRLPNMPQAVASKTKEGHWRIHLESGQPRGSSVAPPEEGVAKAAPSQAAPVYKLDRDIVVYWRYAEGLPGRVEVVAHRPAGEKRGTFMLVLTPGIDLKPITEGRDWAFILDISGSMRSKYQTLVEGVNRGLRNLGPKDRFRVVLFNDKAAELTRGYVTATPQKVKEVSDALRAITPMKGTNLFAGLVEGLKGLDSDRSSGLVLVTDGVANVGTVNRKAFLKLVDKKDVRLFTMVMGNSANRPLLEAISKRSGGAAINVSGSDDVIGAVMSITSKLSHEALHGVKVRIQGIRTSDITPRVAGSLYRGQQLVLFGHYWGDGEAKVEISAKVSGKPVTYRTRFTFPKTATRNPEIERLWAYSSIEAMIEEIDDFGESADIKQGVTELAVEYGLVTRYTSMVVVRDDVFAALGIKRSNRQRLQTEMAAWQQRQAGSVQARRVDRAHPTFASAQPSYGSGGGRGSGAIDPLTLVMVLMAGASMILRRRRTRVAGQ